MKPKPEVVRVNRVRGPLVTKKANMKANVFGLTNNVLIKKPKVKSKPKPEVNIVNNNNSLIAKRRKVLSSSVKESHNKLVQQYRGSIIGLKGIGVGRLLVMLACGPSMNEVDTSLLIGLSHVDIMCINKPDKRVWPSRYWVFADQTQYTRNVGSWDNYNGIIINAASVKARHKKQILVRNISGKGFSRDLVKGFHLGWSSTFAAMQVALYMNYDRVFIFGCDMTDVNGILHYYGNNPDVDDKNRKSRFEKEADFYMHAANILEERERSKFVFCSSHNPWPFVEKFGRLDHKKAIDKIIRKNGELNGQD